MSAGWSGEEKLVGRGDGRRDFEGLRSTCLKGIFLIGGVRPVMEKRGADVILVPRSLFSFWGWCVHR